MKMTCGSLIKRGGDHHCFWRITQMSESQPGLGTVFFTSMAGQGAAGKVETAGALVSRNGVPV